jgi:hypothetical protein
LNETLQPKIGLLQVEGAVSIACHEPDQPKSRARIA